MTLRIDRVTGADAAAMSVALAPVLRATVAAGASVGWVAPPSIEEATAWWAGLFADAEAVTWVARDRDEVLGTISLLRSWKPNGRHRGEVVKLMVAPEARGRGVAPALMAALETFAAQEGLGLLVLDTETGSLAERLYVRWGWQTVGSIPDFAVSPDGRLGGTTVMYKRLVDSVQGSAAE